jgi:hypothetical protein
MKPSNFPLVQFNNLNILKKKCPMAKRPFWNLTMRKESAKFWPNRKLFAAILAKYLVTKLLLKFLTYLIEFYLIFYENLKLYFSGLAGQSEFEQIKVDELTEWYKDIGRDFGPYVILAHGPQYREVLGLQNTTKVK